MREAEAIAAALRIVPIADAIRGPGDDAAVLSPPDGNLVWATDLVIEGRHFDLAWSSLADAAFKAVARNASDLAAMGAAPVAFLAAVALPEADEARIHQVATGLADAARAFVLPIVGGDLSRSEPIVFAVSVLGRVDDAGLGRDGAKPGDVLAVTGTLGAAASALAAHRAGDAGAEALLRSHPELEERFRRGTARLEAGRALRGIAHAAIDVSDGILLDASRIATASEVELEVDRSALPVAEGVREIAAALDLDPLALACGGDDYELLMTLPESDLAEARAAIAPLPLTVIGAVRSGAARLIDPHGDPIPLEGHDHFA